MTITGERATAGRERARRRAARRTARSALLFLSPWIVGFVVFTAWPLV
ncbi:hypothetical protein [Microbacterium lacticum]|uniref:Uncharacterized protein n=1 Tax=Microbacterium lacticum TaxID=33885 RepID=A0A543KSV5_9MICO|nr:hypothetical protein [Microbacterium lacticum]TQM98157.1 hypothetical protein FHX68_2189 [Microbacterium lacticum]